MDIKIIKPDKTDLEVLEEQYNDTSEVEEGPQKLESSDPSELQKVAVRQVLEIEKGDTEYDDDVDILLEWAKEKVGDDMFKMKWAIRDLIMRLGTPTFGDHIKNVSRFAYLEMEEKRIKQEKQSFR